MRRTVFAAIKPLPIIFQKAPRRNCLCVSSFRTVFNTCLSYRSVYSLHLNYRYANSCTPAKDIVRQHSYSLTAETFKTASVRHWTFDFGFQTIVFVNKYTRIRIFAVPSKSRIYFLIEPSTCTIRVRNNQIAGTRRGRKYLPWTPEI